MRVEEMAAPGFQDPALHCFLDGADAACLDRLAFGVIRLDRTGEVVFYNAAESEGAGLAPARVLGRHFFTAVAPCMNNVLVASRFELEAELDATIDYVLTMRMRPTPVHLRLLATPSSVYWYVLVLRL